MGQLVVEVALDRCSSKAATQDWQKGSLAPGVLDRHRESGVKAYCGEGGWPPPTPPWR
jgi:hypothetical protein